LTAENELKTHLLIEKERAIRTKDLEWLLDHDMIDGYEMGDVWQEGDVIHITYVVKLKPTITVTLPEGFTLRDAKDIIKEVDEKRLP
jgi:hypothetical protein